MSFSASGPNWNCGSTSSTTWYWFCWVSMVETMRWPNASDERVVDRRRQDAVARGDVAVDGDVEQRPGVLLVAGDVRDARNGLELVEEERGPVVEFAGIGIGQRILILGLGQPRRRW